MNRHTRVFPTAETRTPVYRILWRKGVPIAEKFHVKGMAVNQITLEDVSGRQVTLTGKEQMRLFALTPAEAAIIVFQVLASEIARQKKAVTVELVCQAAELAVFLGGS